MTSENCCDELYFKELVRCYEESGYKKAHGWTESTGQSGSFQYHPPSPWEYDLSFSDTRGKNGSHGACRRCAVTLVHLMKPIIPSGRPAPCTAPDGIGYGDIDGDGFVTASDADYIANHIVGKSGYPLSAAQKIRADVNGDGKIDIVDTMLIAKFANHVPGYDTFPVCSLAHIPLLTFQCFTKGAGYTCISSAPGQLTLTKRPARSGCGSVAASSVFSVPSGGGKIMFNADIYMLSWASPIRMEIVSGIASGIGGIGSGEVVQVINRGVRQSNKAYTVDVSKYAGKNVTFIVSSIDNSIKYCNQPDHNFDVTIRDFKVVPVTIAPSGFGDIVGIYAPDSVDHSADVEIKFKIHNTGESSGLFIVRLYQGNTDLGEKWRGTVPPGQTTSEKTIHATAPTTGTSVTYTLKSFLRT